MRKKREVTYREKLEYFFKNLPNRVLAKTECWEWQGSILSGGYGDMELRGKNSPYYWRERPHRFSYMHFYQKEIPKGMHIAHSCDNRKCCNYQHLFLATPKENYQDAVNKQRMHTPAMRSFAGKKAYKSRKINRFGELISEGDDPNIRKGRILSFEEKSNLMKRVACRGENRSKKLTNESVKEIFDLRSKGWSYKKIGQKFGVDHTCIYKIAKGKRWQHLKREEARQS